MSQANLNKWLNINDLNIPKYFYWKWGNNAIWTHEKKSGNFEALIMWKDFNHKIYLVGDYPQNELFNLKNQEDLNIPLLKSHLQKCIRRKLHTKAVKTAYQLINYNFNEFIRRINIIMLEDVILMDSYCNLIWMMLAFSTKKWNPERIHVEWLLGVVHNLCESNLYNEYTTLNISPKKLYISNLNQEQKSLIYSMQIRTSYGGLKSDMIMIQDLINRNIDTFRNGGNVNKIKVRRVSIVLEFLPYKQFHLSGVDFHCYPFMIKSVKKKYPELFEDEISKLIWIYSSGVNPRKNKIPKENDKWKKIKKYVEWLSRKILESIE